MRFPLAGEVWVKGSYRQVRGDIGRVGVEEVIGSGLKGWVRFTHRFGPKRGITSEMAMDRFIKLYDAEVALPLLAVAENRDA